MDANLNGSQTSNPNETQNSLFKATTIGSNTFESVSAYPIKGLIPVLLNNIYRLLHNILDSNFKSPNFNMIF